MSSVGTLLNGRYVLLKKLDENRRGTIYRARDSVLNRVVAIQMLKETALGGEDHQLLWKKAQATMKLTHPNIVEFYDMGNENSKHFSVLELIDGENLCELMRTYPEGKCDVQLVLRVALDICGALQFAHSQGFLHLGIKPENILVTKDGAGKLAGLGLEEPQDHIAVAPDGSIKAPSRVPTGFTEVDNVLLGGIPKSHSVILASPTCEKRDVLIKKFLETGAKSDGATFYLTIDPRETKTLIEEFQTNFRAFICNPRADTIIENLPSVSKLKGIENLTAIDIALASAFKTIPASSNGPRRACIEIISDVLLQHHAVVTRRWLVGLLPELTARGFVTLGVINPQMHPSEEVQAITGLFNGELTIIGRETEKGLEEQFTAKRIYTKEQLRKECDAIAYLPPEMIFEKPVDTRSDLYALGSVLYEALTGKPVFYAEDPAKAISNHLYGNPVPCGRLNPKIPTALANCIMKLLEKNPEKRYQSANSLLEELKEIAKKMADTKEISSTFTESLLQIGQTQALAAREIPLINRIEESSKIRTAIQDAISGAGGLVLLNGEAGIGKTRLAKEASAYAQLRGMEVLNGRYPALFNKSGVPPYVLWSEAIREYVATASSEKLQLVIGPYPAEVTKLVPELKQKLLAVPQSMPISPDHEQYRFFEAISQLITNISRQTPLLIVLEDLQWADKSSLLLLYYLARGTKNEPLLILGTYRDNEIDEKHVLSSIITDLNRELAIQNIPLNRMSLTQTIEMIKAILEQSDVPKDFCQLMYEKTRGNPFFIQEIMKDLQEEMIIYQEGSQWKIKNISTIEFPQSVKSIVKSRIEKLNDETQNVLVTASIIGERFTFEALREITKIDENKLFDFMEKILKTGLVRENIIHGEDSYSFVDAVVREVLHEEVSHLRRKRIHNNIGSALERLYKKTIEEYYGDLAYHFLEGDDEAKAIDYFLKAAENAERTYAHNEAFSYLHQAFELIKTKPEFTEKEAAITEKLGDLKALTGEPEAFMDYWKKSLNLWTQLNDRKGISRLNGKMAHMLWETIGNKEEASKHHQLALEILANEPESQELASLYEDISRMLWRSGKHADALPWAEKAWALAQKLGDPEILARTYANMGALSLLETDYDKGAKYFEEGAKIAIQNNCVASLRILQNLAISYGGKGDFAKGFETSQKGFQLSKTVGDVTWIAWNGFQLAYLYIFMGEIQKAISILEEVLTLDKKTKNLTQIANVIGTLGRCYAISGERDKSIQYLTEALGLTVEIGDYQITGNINQWLGDIYMEMCDLEKAEKYLNEANSIFEKAQDVLAQLSDTAPALASLYTKKGETQKAGRLVTQIYEHAKESGSKVEMADAELYLGNLLREQKNFGEAIRHFDSGLKLYESLEAKKWYALRYTELLYGYGLAYLERNETGDPERAYVLFDRTLEMYKRIGASKRIEEIETRKKQLIN